ncbi:MAG TPA: 7TM diverse intracellular signaling domain-containing protein [Oligoflexus sp.]|uniref:7TM diverse intracellular signaling domain-containing protein n=1 Tax=Oligoflexus sp. TaxID=1971216 RepID=UPI002D615A1A|nr:7TM diverse intracellular signaling domain-containing protein [Oligoflexus sp.]HYX33937.1 7TM diverse intracellular signaling domain-containing protein [Oligoflexus sp.]
MATDFPSVVQNWHQLTCLQGRQEIPNLTMGRGDFWLKVRLNLPASQAKTVILEHSWPSDYVKIIHMTPAGIASQAEFGNDVDQSHPILNRYAAQKLEMQPGENTIYIHLKHIGTVLAPVRIWSEEAFQQSKFEENVAAGILVGVTLAMVFYNIFLYLTFRVTSQLYYAGFLVTTFWYLFFYSGLVTYVPQPWREIWTQTWIASGSMALMLLSRFTQHFLNVGQKSRRLLRLFQFYSWVFTLSVVCNFIHRETAYILFITFLTPYILTCIWAGVLGLFKKERHALFYLLSFSLVLIGGSLENLIAFGLISPKWAFWPLFTASNLQVMLLSLALGDKLQSDQKAAHNRIMNLNEELQKHVHHVNDLVDEKTREIRSVMENIPQGLLMIKQDLTIHRDYSAYCTTLFEHQTIENREAIPVIFNQALLGEDQRAQIQSALQACMGDSELTFQMNEDCFPREFSRQTPGAETQTLEMDWHPIVDSQENIERILVSVRDVTSLRTLQHHSEEQTYRLALIGEIINVDQLTFVRFLKSCRTFNAENKRLVDNLVTNDPEVHKILFINLHTMKGVARSLHLSKMADLFHNIEHHLAALQMGQVEFSQDALKQEIEKIEQLLHTYESVFTRDLHRSSQADEHAIIPMKHLEPLVQRIDTLNLDDGDDTRKFVAEVTYLFTNLYYQEPQKIFVEVFSGLARLAKDLAKEVPHVHMELDNVLLVREAEDLIRNVFVHLLRNSMDHGIESPVERMRKGKSSKGLIDVQLREDAGVLRMSYRDDGCGFDLNAIRAAALKKGFIQEHEPVSVERLVQLILTTGFTTSQTVSEISGRGVGMDAVSRYIQQLGGTFEIRLPDNVDESWSFIPILFIMTLPPRFYRVSKPLAA